MNTQEIQIETTRLQQEEAQLDKGFSEHIAALAEEYSREKLAIQQKKRALSRNISPTQE
jgi:hypothetical protein